VPLPAGQVRAIAAPTLRALLQADAPAAGPAPPRSAHARAQRSRTASSQGSTVSGALLLFGSCAEPLRLQLVDEVSLAKGIS
jgi:hypothetical protein